MNRFAIFLAALAAAAPFCCPAAAQESGSVRLAQFQGPPRGPSEEDKQRFRERLGLTRQQQDQIDALFNQTNQRMRDLRDKYRDLQQKLGLMYDHYDFDRAEARDLRHQIIGLHVKMGRIHDDNEEQLRKILAPAQFEKMKAMIREDMEKKRREFEQRHHGGPPPGGPF